MSDGRIHTAAHFSDVNTYDEPAKVSQREFSSLSLDGNTITLELPPLSVIAFKIE